ncbi:hypothetical protein D0T53_03685 [Dysgonomonas sp. 216]|uniref:hypothetical protein n=1 Tax=Dysgonomonas sp. 216 TaxID=2302934 RepID=UPI0013D67B7A|nr:hypothetical protein [Dysgonomonas sp. 216]NDW18017.1 hypothetical protein [Dysgonomonas sp. 216]
MNPKLKNVLYQLSAIVILLAAVLYNSFPQIAPYAMGVGVAGFGAITFTSPYPGDSLRGRRLFNMQIFAVLFMIISTYLMFVNRNEWIVPLLISGILILYSSIFIGRELEKEKKEKEKQS